MKYTDNEIKEMHRRLAAIAIVAMLRFFKYSPMDGRDYKEELSSEFRLKRNTFASWKKNGCPVSRVNDLVKFCHERGVPFYRHQFSPNSETVLSNLEYYLHIDQKVSVPELRVFKYWDPNLPLSPNRRADNANHCAAVSTRFLLEPNAL